MWHNRLWKELPRSCRHHYMAWCPSVGLAECGYFFGGSSCGEQVCLKFFSGVSLVKFGPSSCAWCGVALDVLIAMGGDPVITEPVVLSMEEEVRAILEDSRLLPLFKKLSGHNEAITNQFMETWKNGKVTINGMHIDVSEGLIVEVTGLPNDGELVSRDKMDQVSQLTKFIKENETFCWLDSGIARESLPQPWDRVAIQVMKYITLEGKFRKLFGYHVAILNSLRNREKINIPLFLCKSMEKLILSIKAGKTKSPRHQGLMKLIVEHTSNRLGSSMGPSRGAAIRVSGVPITKSQLLIGPAPPSLLLTLINSESDANEDLESQGMVSPVIAPKEKEGKKRKLNDALAKRNRRSSRVQRKSAGKSNVIVDIGSSDEEQKIDSA
eukprot:Gb_40876 [translate_table: standard]